MKLSILTTALFGFLFVAPAFAISEYQIRVLFNNGVPVPDMSCNSVDMTLINTALTYGRRNLRQGKIEIEESSIDQDLPEDEKERKLATLYPATCKGACQGQTPGYCTAAGCKGFRRELEEEEADRELNADFWCPQVTNMANLKLNALVSSSGALSSSCKLLLNKPRTMHCLTMIC